MEVTNERQKLIWSEILATAKQEVAEIQQENEMTVRQFAEQTGMTINWARKFLDHQVELKRLQKRVPKIKGRNTALYSPATDQD